MVILKLDIGTMRALGAGWMECEAACAMNVQKALDQYLPEDSRFVTAQVWPLVGA